MKKILTIAAIAMLSAVTAVQADLIVNFDVQQVDLAYSSGTKVLTVSDNDSGSRIVVTKENDVTNAVLDSAVIDNGVAADSFDYLSSFTMTQNGVNDWSAAGTIKYTDVVQASNAVESTFTSTGVTLLNGVLTISGVMTPLAPATTMLVNRGNPWKYAGVSDLGGAADEDGVTGQITMDYPENYTAGTVLTFKFGVSQNDLDTLFGADRSFSAGEVKGIIVPAPGAVLLGLMGLSLIGWARRRVA